MSFPSLAMPLPRGLNSPISASMLIVGAYSNHLPKLPRSTSDPCFSPLITPESHQWDAAAALIRMHALLIIRRPPVVAGWPGPPGELPRAERKHGSAALRALQVQAFARATTTTTKRTRAGEKKKSRTSCLGLLYSVLLLLSSHRRPWGFVMHPRSWVKHRLRQSLRLLDGPLVRREMRPGSRCCHSRRCSLCRRALGWRRARSRLFFPVS